MSQTKQNFLHGVLATGLALALSSRVAVAADITVFTSQVGPPRQGGIPIIAGASVMGAIAVSGAPTGDKDEPCAVEGLGRIRNRLQ